MKSTMAKNVSVTLDLPEIQLDNVSEEISSQHVELMKNMIASSRFACADKISTESTVNVNSQSLVDRTLTGMVPDANVTLDLLKEMEPVFSQPIRSQNAQPTQFSTVLLALVKQDFMKFQDSTVKDVPTDKSGMVLSVHGIPHAQVDTYGAINTEDVRPKQSNAHKTQNGTEPYVFVELDFICQVTCVSAVQLVQLGTEELAIHKFQ
jgi:hypothetical protein